MSKEEYRNEIMKLIPQINDEKALKYLYGYTIGLIQAINRQQLDKKSTLINGIIKVQNEKRTSSNMIIP